MTLPMGGLAPPLSLALRGPVWGLDTQTTRISVAELRLNGVDNVNVRWATLACPTGGNVTTRLGRLALQLRPFLTEFLEPEGVPYSYPARTGVEEPFGHGQAQVHPNSQRYLGVVLACLAEVLGVHPVAPYVELLQPNSWKAAALGQGHGRAQPEAYLRWAQQCAGYVGQLEDEAAAIGVATAMGVRWELERAAEMEP